jgi:sortase B
VASPPSPHPLDAEPRAEVGAGIDAGIDAEQNVGSSGFEPDRPKQSQQARQPRQPRERSRAETSSRDSDRDRDSDSDRGSDHPRSRDRDRDRPRSRPRTRARADRPKSPDQPDAPKTSRFRLSLALGIVFIVIALVIGVFLIYGSMSADQDARNLRAVAEMEIEGGGEVPPDADLSDLKVNWDKLKELSPDAVGWVMIPGTSINYPIVRASDNEFYLSHLATKTPNDNGAIFLDSENDPAISGWNNIIYGHNLLNGTMFARLKYYSERAFFDEHRTILLATPEKNYRLRVDAALVCDADDKVRRFSFSNREDYESYVRMLLEYAVINEIAEGSIPENLYGFVTCTDTNYSKRTMILASVVEERSS